MSARTRRAFVAPGSWWLSRAALLAALGLVAAVGAIPADDKPAQPADAPKPAVALHKLPNDALLQQASTLYDKASGEYLGQLRALAAAELLFDEAGKKTAGPETPDNPTPTAAAPAEPGANPAIEEATKAVAEAKKKQDAAKERHKLALARKELLNRVATEIEGTRSAAVAFLNALDDLKPFAVETGLRVKDGTLSDDRVPQHLKPAALEKKRAEIAAEPARLKAKQAEVTASQAAVGKQLEEADKAVLAADADLAQASRKLVREQKRQEIEKAYAGKSPDEMLAELNAMVNDGKGLKKAHEDGRIRFDKQNEVVSGLRKDLDALKAPETKIPQLTRPEDVEQAIKSLEQLLAYYAERSKRFEALRAALVTLADMGSEFEGNAAVSTEHLFRMQVLSDLLVKAGAKDRLPSEAEPKRLEEASTYQSETASAVLAGTEKAKAEIAQIDKQLADTVKAKDAAAAQLAGLKESREATLAVLNWEKELQAVPDANEVAGRFTSTRQALTAGQEKLKTDEGEYKAALAAVTDARAKLDGLKDPLLREAEELGQSERQKILAELRKEAELDRAAKEPAATTPAPEPKKPDSEPDTRHPDTRPERDKKPDAPKPTELEKTAQELTALQQLLAGRVRVMDEREAKTKDLLAALDVLDQRAKAYSATLNEARQLAYKLNAAGAELKKRAGRGLFPAERMPEGVTVALKQESRAGLDTSSTAVLTVVSQVRQEQERLRQPDPDADALKAATKELLSLVGQRLDLIADLKRLAADYARARKDRPPSETKRLDQIAADRLSDENGRWDWFLALDSSQTSKNLTELLEAYYQELIDLEEKEEILKKQHEKIDQLVELTQKEASVLNRALPLIEKQVAKFEAAREEEFVLARARLKPEQADELLKGHQAKTGKLLAKPVPAPEKEKAQRVDEMASALFDRYVQSEAARKWLALLGGRLAPTGLKAEAGVYQDELARLNATTGANARRVQTLTGNTAPEADGTAPAVPPTRPAAGGEIGRTRDELTKIRKHGLAVIGYKVLAILIAALLLPRILMFLIGRAVGRGGEAGGNTGLVLTAVRAFVKVAIWVTAIALILRLLGFDVTAIVAGLGIGGLAIGLAAQPMIADVIAAIVIVAERRFKIGDVIRLGGDEPARVMGMTWRSTQFKNPDGLLVNVPNRKVAEASVQNLTRSGRTYDSLNVSITTQRDVGKVLGAIRKAMEECPHLSADHGVSVKEYTHKGEKKEVKYRFWWFLMDYETRNATRDEVFTRVTATLADADLAGTEVTLS